MKSDMRVRLALGAVLLTTTACSTILSKLRGGDDAGEDAAVEVTVEAAAPIAPVPAVDAAPAPPALPPPEPDAKNGDQLTRYAAEVNLANAAAVLDKAATSVREDVPNGKVTATLRKGTEVIKVVQAKVQGKQWVLVNFANGSDPKERLAGWVAEESFAAGGAAAAIPAAGKCAAGLTMLWGETASCEKVCAKETDCTGGGHCFGMAPLLVDGGPGKATRYCVGDNKSATPPKPKADGGGATGTDAGPRPSDAGSLVDTLRDAGGVLRNLLSVLERPVDGKCREGRVLVETYCRIPCASDTECSAKIPTTVCVDKAGQKVCSAGK